MRLRFSRFALIAAVMLVLLPDHTFAGRKEKNQQPPIDPRTLVWPMPPDKPRVKFVEEWDNNLQIEPVRKRSWSRRLAGVQERQAVESFRKPAGIGTDSQGRIYVASLEHAVVYVIDKEHRQLLRLPGGQGIAFRSPVGVVIDVQDNLYVSDTQLHTVLKFDPQLRLVANFGFDDGLRAPAYMSIDRARKRLYVADTRAHGIFVYDLDRLKLLQKLGTFGENDTEFQYPVGVAVNQKTGEFAVTDTGSCSVRVFDADYRFVRRFGSQAMTPGNFVRPKGIAYDSDGNIWVADAAFNNFQIFTETGQVRMFVGSAGTGPGQFQLPNALYIDKNNRVYVGDQLNGRVQVFQYLGSN